MKDDDQLAQDYIAVAIVHALNHLVEHLGPEHYTEEQWQKLNRLLRRSRIIVAEKEEEMDRRFLELEDIPF